MYIVITADNIVDLDSICSRLDGLKTKYKNFVYEITESDCIQGYVYNQPVFSIYTEYESDDENSLGTLSFIGEGLPELEDKFDASVGLDENKVIGKAKELLNYLYSGDLILKLRDNRKAASMVANWNCLFSTDMRTRTSITSLREDEKIKSIEKGYAYWLKANGKEKSPESREEFEKDCHSDDFRMALYGAWCEELSAENYDEFANRIDAAPDWVAAEWLELVGYNKTYEKFSDSSLGYYTYASGTGSAIIDFMKEDYENTDRDVPDDFEDGTADVEQHWFNDGFDDAYMRIDDNSSGYYIFAQL